jgi:hypothetical protein
VIDVPEHLTKRTKLATVLAALAVPLILAPVAHADPAHFYAYLDCLKAGGLVIDDVNQVFVLRGAVRCNLLNASDDTVTRELQDQYGLSAAKAATVVSCSRMPMTDQGNGLAGP